MHFGCPSGNSIIKAKFSIKYIQYFKNKNMECQIFNKFDLYNNKHFFFTTIWPMGSITYNIQKFNFVIPVLNHRGGYNKGSLLCFISLLHTNIIGRLKL